MKPLPFAAAMLLSTLLFAACGVRFRDPPEGNEFFESLDIEGERRAGAVLTAAVDYEQLYPVRVDFQCDLVQDKKVLRTLARQGVQPHPEGSPKATPKAGYVSIQFVVEQPGTYSVECLTPLDEDNIIGKQFKIAG